MTKVFFDADVLLDLFLEREPHHTVALRLLTELRRSKTGCFTSPVVFANVHYILAKAKGQEYSVRKLRSLRGMIGIASVDQEVVDTALEAPYKDFEDSLQMHCAHASGIGILITRNLKHYPKGKLQVRSPVEYLSSRVFGKSG